MTWTTLAGSPDCFNPHSRHRAHIRQITSEGKNQIIMITDSSCREFVEILSSKEPVPGGGSASALLGAIGTALGNMVGHLTVGKKKYAAVEDEMHDMMDRCEKIQHDMLNLVERDAEAFTPLAKAYGMPRDTEEQKREKERVMAIVLQDACAAPLEIMRKCCEAIDMCEEFANKGSRLAISDAGVGVVFCKAALQGASLNVFINTKAMKDRESAERINDEADSMLFEYTVKADTVYAQVQASLRGWDE